MLKAVSRALVLAVTLISLPLTLDAAANPGSPAAAPARRTSITNAELRIGFIDRLYPIFCDGFRKISPQCTLYRTDAPVGPLAALDARFSHDGTFIIYCTKNGQFSALTYNEKKETIKADSFNALTLPPKALAHPFESLHSMDSNGSILWISNGNVLLVHRSPEGIRKMFELFVLEELIFLNYLFLRATAPAELAVLPVDRFEAYMRLFPVSIQAFLKDASLADYIKAHCPRGQRVSTATIADDTACGGAGGTVTEGSDAEGTPFSTARPVLVV